MGVATYATWIVVVIGPVAACIKALSIRTNMELSTIASYHVNSSILQSSETREACGSAYTTHGSNYITTLPPHLLDDPSAADFIHVRDDLKLPMYPLPYIREIETTFTLLLRTMADRLSRSPCGWYAWLGSWRDSNRRKIFSRRHIRALRFERGDTFGGAFRVVDRKAAKIEIAFADGDVSERIVFSLWDADYLPEYKRAPSHNRQHPRCILRCDRLQWVEKGSGVLPLRDSARAVWWHRYLGWRTMVEGGKFLRQRRLDSLPGCEWERELWLQCIAAW
nr:hypothetical protein B0A51_14763 [Rachicladosporium sp. CCFEE 5018]